MDRKTGEKGNEKEEKGNEKEKMINNYYHILKYNNNC